MGDVSQLVGDDRWIPTQSVEVVQKNKVIGVDSATSRGISVAAVVMEKLELSSKRLRCVATYSKACSFLPPREPSSH